MIEITQQAAIVSFCLDMQDPNAKSVPIGVVLAADLSDGRSFAAVVALQQPSFDGIRLSAVSSILLKSLSPSIQKIVNSAWERVEGSETVPSVMEALVVALRTSVHVARVVEPLRQTVGGSDRALEEALIDSAIDILEQEREGAKPLTTPSPSPSWVPPASALRTRASGERGRGLSRYFAEKRSAVRTG